MVAGRLVALTTTAISLNDELGLERGHYHFVLRGAAGVYLGDAAVSTTNGFQLSSSASDYLHLDLRPGDEVYLVSSSTSNIYVLAYEV